MQWKQLVCAVALLTVVHAGESPADEARVAGSENTVKAIQVDSQLLLHVDDVAGAFGWVAKVVTPGKLLTICREEKGGICVPLQLDSLTSKSADDGLYVEAKALARALRFDVAERNGTLRLEPRQQADDNAVDLPAYNAAWGEGRGFRVGQTLPDIPLYDMQGREVRFSRYLGKQYILYCWASW